MIRNGIDITKCDIRCCGDLMYEDNYINAVYELWFDVETYFDITLDDNSWIDLYTNWFSNGDIEVIVEYDADKGDKISYLPFEPDEDEKTFFISKMEERCMKLYGESLMEFYEERT